MELLDSFFNLKFKKDEKTKLYLVDGSKCIFGFKLIYNKNKFGILQNIVLSYVNREPYTSFQISVSIEPKEFIDGLELITIINKKKKITEEKILSAYKAYLDAKAQLELFPMENN